MGSLLSAFTRADGSALVARNSFAILLATPLIGVLVTEVYPMFASMPPAQAVVFFGAVGGISGLASQYIAGGVLGEMDRNVNALEMIPAILGSVGGSVLATWLLLPPSRNLVTTTLKQSGSLPS